MVPQTDKLPQTANFQRSSSSIVALITQDSTKDIVRIGAPSNIHKYLLASDQRRHVWHSWLTSRNANLDRDREVTRRFPTLWRSKDIILDGFVCCPPGLISALGRLAGHSRTA